MHKYEIIQNYDLQSLLSIMCEAGLPSVAAKHHNQVDAARRTFPTNGTRLSYDVMIIDEMLKFVGEVKGKVPNPQFVVEWNNLSAIAPLICLTDGAMLVFDVNIRRSIPFGTFSKIANSFEDALKQLVHTVPPF